MMACRFFGLFALLALLTAVAGCGHMNPPRRALYQQTFATGTDTGQVLQAPPAMPVNEAPYVKIISGTAVESLEEAQRKLAEQAASAPGGLEQKIGTLKLRNVTVRTLTELMTEAYDYNVVATRRVADQIIDINLRNISLRAAVESICRLNDLWYREGAGIITLMTREEYVQDVQVRQTPQTRAFFVRYTNAADMAKVIQASMGKEVYLAAIEDEKVYGHIDPEEDLDVGSGDYEAPELRDTRIRKSGGFRSAQSGAAGQAESAGPQRYESTFGASAQGEGSRQEEEALLAVLTVFKRNNCIVARSLDEALLNEMGRIIEALDTPTNQVLLEVKILQLNINDGFESFFEFEFKDDTDNARHALGVLGTKVAGVTSLNYLFNSADIQARVALYEKEGRLEVVSTPFLMAANNSKVEFFVGEEIPLRGEVTSETTTTKDTGTTTNTFTQEIEEEELGTDVEMTTFINADGTVTLDFDAEISSAQLAYSSVQSVNDITGEIFEFPIDGTTKSEIKAILSARSGQSIAIGGIIRETIDDSISKVPVLGDIPGLGFFFREIAKTKSKTETVILLTPHVIMHPALAGRVSEEFLGRKSSHEQVTVGRENILSEGQ